MSGAYQVLKEGGEFYFSDVYCDRRLSEEIRNHKILVGECIGGALYTEDFRRICQNVGFNDPRILNVSEIKIEDSELKLLLGNAKFYSITYRLFKNKLIEDKCEDYGQIAIYDGSIKEHPNYYDLDNHHRFITNKPMLVCANTANMVGNTWLKSHFKIIGDMSTHYGLFDCAPVNIMKNNGYQYKDKKFFVQNDIFVGLYQCKYKALSCEKELFVFWLLVMNRNFFWFCRKNLESSQFASFKVFLMLIKHYQVQRNIDIFEPKFNEFALLYHYDHD